MVDYVEAEPVALEEAEGAALPTSAPAETVALAPVVEAEQAPGTRISLDLLACRGCSADMSVVEQESAGPFSCKPATWKSPGAHFRAIALLAETVGALRSEARFMWMPVQS